MHRGTTCARLALLAICGLVAIGRPASAHVSSSEETNNRYYKLTPMSDRVRLAYTIFFGREPGLVMRQRMDVDHNGVLSSEEVSSYGQVIADEVFASVSFLYGAKQAELSWQDVEVGMESLEVGGGPFSVDFIGTVCLDEQSLGYEHQFVFRDRLRLPKPGETELSMAPAPGIRIVKSLLDGRPSRHGEKWQGGPGPAQMGYEFAFAVDNAGMAVLDKSCAPRVSAGSSRWIWILAGGGSALTLLLFGAMRSRRSRQRKGQTDASA